MISTIIGGLIVVLIICALISAIWGKEAAQKTFGCIVTIVVIAVIALIWFVGAAMNSMHSAPQ